MMIMMMMMMTWMMTSMAMMIMVTMMILLSTADYINTRMFKTATNTTVLENHAVFRHYLVGAVLVTSISII